MTVGVERGGVMLPEADRLSAVPLSVLMGRAHVAWARRLCPWLLTPWVNQ